MSDQRAQDAEALKKLGYAQALLRDMGGFSNFALSFSIISILTGAVQLYGHGLKWGGPFIMTVGWPMVAFFTLMMALSLAELASAFPTAGALYHWASLLGGRGWGFFTAWLNVLGQFAITAAIDYGLAEFLAPMLGYGGQRSVVLAIYAVLLVSHAALNHVGVKVVARLNTVSAWWHVGGVLALVLALVAMAPLQPVSFLLVRQSAETPTYAWGFLVGLLQAAWTFTGYDASAHATEETVDPARNAPRGIVLSVVVSAIAGFVMLAVVTLAVPSLELAWKAPNAFLYIFSRLGTVGDALVWMVLIAMWFCGLASITSNSRMLFAFARDGGLPFSAKLATVSPRFSSPHVAIWVSAAMALVVALWADAYSAMAALSTVALYVSYALPIALGFFARRSGRWTVRGPWNLGKWSGVVNVIAVLWVIFISVLMSVPPNALTGKTFAGVLAVLAIAWFAVVRKHFRGPGVSLQDFQRR